jgi:hypothetical protein
MEPFYHAMQVQVRLAVTLKIIVKLRLASHMGVSVIAKLSTTVKVSKQVQDNFWLYDLKNVIVCVIMFLQSLLLPTDCHPIVTVVSPRHLIRIFTNLLSC